MENNPSPRHTAKEPCDTPPGERRRGLGVFVIWPLAALLFYVLSFGPVDWFFGVGPPAVRVTYAPLLWTYKHLPPFRVAFDAYVGLWDKHW